MIQDPDERIRAAAFAELRRRTESHGPVLPWEVIAAGFEVEGRHFFWASRARGIFRPKEMNGAALSIKTTVPREGRRARYDDREREDGRFHYRLQGTDPRGHDNRALEVAYERQTPLIYFFGLAPGLYCPLWPVFVTGWHPEALTCIVQADRDDAWLARGEPSLAEPTYGDARSRIRREYATMEVKRRLHQEAFREDVVAAYKRRCAICGLPRDELLEATHIVPDSEGGEPEVPNGLALCRLHHGAFDRYLLGIRPDRTIILSQSLLDTRDGPMLEHGLRPFHHQRIAVPDAPTLRPREEYLDHRFLRFLEETA